MYPLHFLLSHRKNPALTSIAWSMFSPVSECAAYPQGTERENVTAGLTSLAWSGDHAKTFFSFSPVY
ncbi:MAG: hypothetical protein XD89_0645 [Anaerolineae bacterium 49_20]|nr:MAG: hypothetical protein XD89_0645 [Anaerolineae bacterium 49_20]